MNVPINAQIQKIIVLLGDTVNWVYLIYTWNTSKCYMILKIMREKQSSKLMCLWKILFSLLPWFFAVIYT